MGTFSWECHPKAEALIVEAVEEMKGFSAPLRLLEEQLRSCSTELFDWIDSITVPTAKRGRFEEYGFTEVEKGTWMHLGAQFPKIRFDSSLALGVKVDSIADFLMVRGLYRSIEGAPYASYRQAKISDEGGVELWAVERRGSLSFVAREEPPHVYLTAMEFWKCRSRLGIDDEYDLKEAHRIAKNLVKTLGQSRAACAVLECERAYWQAKNQAGQIQKNRQDRWGMGWANHDHHTFRSSRRFFRSLVQIFEGLGFFCRERFYAGEQAGWGAQVMEHREAQLVLFLDVDLAPEELDIDFAHTTLSDRVALGTIGLWCALHGESIGRAGMHHLEAQFSFEQLTEDLKGMGVGMMAPFSHFPYLKQAFTEGQMWPVAVERIKKLQEKGQITLEQAERFLHKGALGSHLENLQRKEGYKGFNKNNVSDIIIRTRP